LGLAADATVTPEQVDNVRKRVEANEIDIVPWLEQGQHGQPLKVRLKFVSEPKPATQPNASQPPPKVPVGNLPPPQVVRVPQVRARITPTVAYVPIPPSPFWRMVHIASYGLLAILTAVSLISMISLESREAFTESDSFKSLPLQGLLKFLIFREQSQSDSLTLEDGTSTTVEVAIPKPLRMDVTLDLPQAMAAAKSMHVRLLDSDNNDNSITEQNVQIPAGVTHIDLLSSHLKAGNFKLSLVCEDILHGPTAQATLKITYVH
jgi:hypothetical protein